MKKFLLILSCFIAETCEVEKSFAYNIPIRDMMALEDQRAHLASEQLKNCENDPIKLWKTFKNFVLNQISPYAAIINSILNKLERTDQINDSTNIKTILSLLQKESGFSKQTLSFALYEALLSAGDGALWNVEIDPVNTGSILRPQTEKKDGKNVFADNPYKKRHEKLCALAIANDYEGLQYRKMSKEEEYVNNQKLGLIVCNAGLDLVEKQLKNELSQAKNDLNDEEKHFNINLKLGEKLDKIEQELLQIDGNFKNSTNEPDINKSISHKEAPKTSPKKELDPILKSIIDQNEQNIAQKKRRIDYIHKQILNAYYWAMLRNPHKQNLLIGRYTFHYINPQYSTGISITNLNEMPEELQPLFYSDNIIDNTFSDVSIDPTELKYKSDTIDYLRQKGEDPFAIDLDSGLDTYKSKSTKMHHYAICEFAPLLARGLVINPTLDLGIMRILVPEDNTSTKIPHYHFGYAPIKLNPDNRVHILAWFLPTYLLKEEDGCNRLFCRNFCERQIKEELQQRINQKISKELVQAYQNDEWLKKWIYSEGLDQKEKQEECKNCRDSHDLREQFIQALYAYQDFNIEVFDGIQKDMYVEPDSDDEITDVDAANVNEIEDDNEIPNVDDDEFDNLLKNYLNLIEKIENNQKFKATPENSIDPRLPLFSQAPLTFVYREFY